MMKNNRAIEQQLDSGLENCRAAVDKLGSTLRQIGTDALSELDRWAAKLKERPGHALRRFAGLRGIGARAWRGVSETLEGIRTSFAESLRPMRARMTRGLHARLTKRYYSPVEVAERPVTMKEDPTIAHKVERMRAWMKEHGIDDPPVQRKPPQAVGRAPTPPARPVKRRGNQK